MLLRIIFIFCFVNIVLFSFAQNYKQSRFIQLDGKVIDASGDPIKGATVYVEGTRIGTAADSKGNFQLKVPEKCRIRFSSVGFNELKVDIQGNTYVSIVLYPSMSRGSISVFPDSVSQKRIQHISSSSRFFNYKEDDNIFTRIEVSAQYIRGNFGLKKYLQSEIIYPDSSRIIGVEGLVKVGYIIDGEGSVKDIRVITGVDAACDSQVVHALRKMPKWYPAIQNGKKIDQYFELSVLFSLNNQVKNSETKSSESEQVLSIVPTNFSSNLISSKYKVAKLNNPELKRQAQVLVSIITNPQLLSTFLDSSIGKYFVSENKKSNNHYSKVKENFLNVEVVELRNTLLLYYANTYTENEISALVNFYKTKTGKNILFKQLSNSSDFAMIFLESLEKCEKRIKSER